MKKEERRYYWLKFQKDFFDDLKIKKLRNSIAGGDTYLLIFIRMMALSINNAGIIEYEGIFETIEEELAIKLNEKENDIKVVLEFAISHKMIIKMVDMHKDEYYIPMAAENIGSEVTSAKRVREHRARKQKMLQSNNDVTPMKQIGNTEKETDKTEEKRRADTHIDIEIIEDEKFLLEEWLNNYSNRECVKNPTGFKIHMRKKIKDKDLEALQAFEKWKDEKIQLDITHHEKQKIELFDYSLLVGMTLGNNEILRVATEIDLTTVHITYSDGTDNPTMLKKHIYEWYQSTKEKIA